MPGGGTEAERVNGHLGWSSRRRSELDIRDWGAGGMSMEFKAVSEKGVQDSFGGRSHT